MAYVPRLADQRLKDLLETFPAILINGPRAVGKTTTARQLAVDAVKLSDPNQAAPFVADASAALKLFREPLLLDEWQEVPDVLRAVADAVNEDSRPSRFILTGSVRARLEKKLWSGTGRLIRLNMYGLTQVEIAGRATGYEPFFDRLAKDDPAVFQGSGKRPTLPEYIDLAMQGGFPEVALRRLKPAARDTWFDSYLGQLVDRDLQQLSPRHNPLKMREYLDALAANSAGIPLDATLYGQANVTAVTARRYDRLLQDVFVSEQIPGWMRRRSARLIAAKKRYVVDPALAASAFGGTGQTILSDADLLGRTIDGFVVAQLRPELALAGTRNKVYHLRTKGGRQEVDLVLERPGGKILALEFKAAAAVTKSDAQHLLWLRDLVGANFVAGAVIHTGPAAFRLDAKVLALPISAIWGQ